MPFGSAYLFLFFFYACCRIMNVTRNVRTTYHSPPHSHPEPKSGWQPSPQ